KTTSGAAAISTVAWTVPPCTSATAVIALLPRGAASGSGGSAPRRRGTPRSSDRPRPAGPASARTGGGGPRGARGRGAPVAGRGGAWRWRGGSSGSRWPARPPVALRHGAGRGAPSGWDRRWRGRRPRVLGLGASVTVWLLDDQPGGQVRPRTPSSG